jgi:hypothetical protein
MFDNFVLFEAVGNGAWLAHTPLPCFWMYQDSLLLAYGHGLQTVQAQELNISQLFRILEMSLNLQKSKDVSSTVTELHLLPHQRTCA